MRFYEWPNSAVGSYDIFAAMDESEAKNVLSIFGDGAKTCSLHGQYYYFLNTKKKAIAPLPFLALAFGGQYNGYPPYGRN